MPTGAYLIEEKTYATFGQAKTLIDRQVLNPGLPNYFEAKFGTESLRTFNKSVYGRQSSPYLSEGNRNYMFFIMSNATPFPNTGAPNSFDQALYLLSTNPGKLFGFYIIGSDYIPTAEITDPYNRNQK